MMRFLQSIATMPLSAEKETIHEADRLHLARAERILIDTLTTKFMGIEPLGKLVHMSPSKLKTLFKKEYGKSVFQYYQDKQMDLALKLLKNTGTSVKGVSITLGYDSPSYFTTVFKKYHSFLPSDVL